MFRTSVKNDFWTRVWYDVLSFKTIPLLRFSITSITRQLIRFLFFPQVYYV